MKLTTLLVRALVDDRARRAIAPTFAPVQGGAVSIDGFTYARDSAPAEHLMV